jgi:hypothetical protein
MSARYADIYAVLQQNQDDIMLKDIVRSVEIMASTLEIAQMETLPPQERFINAMKRLEQFLTNASHPLKSLNP